MQKKNYIELIKYKKRIDISNDYLYINKPINSKKDSNLKNIFIKYLNQLYGINGKNMN